MELTTLDMIYSAREVLKGVIDETPVLSSQKISNNVFLRPKIFRRRDHLRYEVHTIR